MNSFIERYYPPDERRGALITLAVVIVLCISSLVSDLTTDGITPDSATSITANLLFFAPAMACVIPWWIKRLRILFRVIRTPFFSPMLYLNKRVLWGLAIVLVSVEFVGRVRDYVAGTFDIPEAVLLTVFVSILGLPLFYKGFGMIRHVELER